MQRLLARDAVALECTVWPLEVENLMGAGYHVLFSGPGRWMGVTVNLGSKLSM